MKLKIEDLTPESFVPFGNVIEQPKRPADAQGPGWKWWGENLILGTKRTYAVGYLDLQATDLRFDWAERHMHSDELIIPMGGNCLIYVAPPEFPDQPDHLPAFETFRVFRIRQGQGALVAEGVWHGAPLAIDEHINVMILLAYGSGREDAYVAKFDENPIWIEQPT